jgi:hypothetical protein
MQESNEEMIDNNMTETEEIGTETNKVVEATSCKESKEAS